MSDADLPGVTTTVVDRIEIPREEWDESERAGLSEVEALLAELAETDPQAYALVRGAMRHLGPDGMTVECDLGPHPIDTSPATPEPRGSTFATRDGSAVVEKRRAKSRAARKARRRARR